jgi:hypothetical protein
MARGLPVVTTSVGAQGLEGAHEMLFIGDTAEEFAAQVLQAAKPAARRKRALAALDFIEEHYSGSTMVEVLENGLGGSYNTI